MIHRAYLLVHGVVASACALSVAVAQPASLSSDLAKKIDDLTARTLETTGVPGASIAVVRDNQIVFVRAYGEGRLEPRTPTRTTMRFGIGSISKQFAAAALLLLAEEGRLSIDDPLARYFPDLTRAKDITLRHLLSHTSGYQDYWPQDFVIPAMLHDVTADKILDRWARQPLDFEPGAQYQYSNTGFVIAGLVAEKVSGQPLFDFLQQRIFIPLGMKSVVNIDQHRLSESDAAGYVRFALGPARPAPKEGKGWLFAAGELAMTAEDLAKWNLALLERRVLKPESYRQLATQFILNNGTATRYGLGLGVASEGSHVTWAHGGEVSGFCSHQLVYPDDRAAIVVFTNRDATAAASTLAKKIMALTVPNDRPADAKSLALDRAVFASLQRGEIDRAQFTETGNFYFTAPVLRDFADSLAPLGKPAEFKQTSKSLRGGLETRTYTVAFKNKQRVEIVVRAEPTGKIEQYQIAAAE